MLETHKSRGAKLEYERVSEFENVLTPNLVTVDYRGWRSLLVLEIVYIQQRTSLVLLVHNIKKF